MFPSFGRAQPPVLVHSVTRILISCECNACRIASFQAITDTQDMKIVGDSVMTKALALPRLGETTAGSSPSLSEAKGST